MRAMSPTSAVLCALAAATLVGCGDNHFDPPVDVLPDAASADAPPVYSGPCWPEGDHTPHGTATLGTGRDGYQPMPDTLPMEFGSQQGFMFITTVRMSGFEPGNPDDVLSPYNPRTRIRAFFADSDVPLNRYSKCPFRTGYVDVGDGAYELAQEAAIVFETCWRSDNLIGKQIRLDLELVDYMGNTYVADSKVVTAAAPVNPGWIENHDSPGCM